MKAAASLLLIVFGFLFFLICFRLGMPQWQGGMMTALAVTCVVLTATMNGRGAIFRGALLIVLSVLWVVFFTVYATFWGLSPLVSMLLSFMTAGWLGTLARPKAIADATATPTDSAPAGNQDIPVSHDAPRTVTAPADTTGLDLSARQREVQEAIQQCILHAACEPIEPDDAALHFEFARVQPRLAELLRKLQIGQESMTIALSSKNRDTAESRMALAEEMYAVALGGYANLMTFSTRDTIKQHMESGRQAFNTNRYINESRGILEKAAKLKTEKARARYRENARAVIREGLANPLSNKERLQTHLSFIGDS